MFRSRSRIFILTAATLLISSSAFAGDTLFQDSDDVPHPERTTHGEFNLGGYDAAGDGAGVSLSGGVTVTRPPVDFKSGIGYELKPGIRGSIQVRSDGRLDHLQAEIPVGAVYYKSTDGGLITRMELVGGKVQFSEDQRTGIVKAGPELSLLHPSLEVPLRQDGGASLCVILPFFAPNEYGIGRIGSQQAVPNLYAQWSGALCAKDDLGPGVGEIRAELGAKFGVGVGSDSAAFTEVYADASMKHIAGTPVQAGVHLSGERVQGADGAHDTNVSQALGTVGLAF